MPWAESCAMDQRMQFIGDWLEGSSAVVELSEAYGVSRKTAYKWIGRYREEGAAGPRERSSAPLEHGRATPPELVTMILMMKDEHRSWGPLKVRAKLEALRPDLGWPVASAIGDILKRAGMVTPRRKRSRVPPTLGKLTVAERPNHLWAADHKGWFKLGNGRRCEPLTVTDSFSRFLVALDACSSTSGAEAIPIFERAFMEYGLPETIRSDNGVPFATGGVTGLSALAVIWAKLGIHHARDLPGNPQ